MTIGIGPGFYRVLQCRGTCLRCPPDGEHAIGDYFDILLTHAPQQGDFFGILRQAAGDFGTGPGILTMGEDDHPVAHGLLADTQEHWGAHLTPDIAGLHQHGVGCTTFGEPTDLY